VFIDNCKILRGYGHTASVLVIKDSRAAALKWTSTSRRKLLITALKKIMKALAIKKCYVCVVKYSDEQSKVLGDRIHCGEEHKEWYHADCFGT
jgi:hypothetical protein